MTTPAHVCPRCKTPWQPGAAFCASCGISYADAWQAPAPSKADAPPTSAQRPRARIAVFAVVAVVAVGLYWSSTTSRARNTTPTSTTAPADVSPITLQGTGSDTYGPQSFTAGLYRVTWNASGSCAFSVEFEPPADGDSPMPVLSALFDEAESGEEVARLDSDRYLVAIGADGCSWGVSISRVP